MGYNGYKPECRCDTKTFFIDGGGKLLAWEDSTRDAMSPVFRTDTGVTLLAWGIAT